MDSKLTFQNEEGIECEDLLYSDEYIKEFHSIVLDSAYSVYAVCGDWGTGKTSFVKMWENKLKNENQIFVHIDAFRMDYETEPFLMLVKAFKKFMKEKNVDNDKNKRWWSKARECFSIKKIARLGFNVFVDKTIGTEPLKKFINDTYDACFDTLSAEESLYDQLVGLLNEITAEFKSPVYIIIDELDRCRPDFALETLERIKHVFHVKNVKFILVYNDAVLASMIKNRYGSAIDAKKYLTKFVQKEYAFNNKKTFEEWFSEEVNNRRFEYRSMSSLLKVLASLIQEIKKAFNLSLRDIQRILSNLEQYEDIQSINLCIIVITIEFLKYINQQEFYNMVAYYNENNKHFAINAPDRHTFTKIFNNLAKYGHGISASADDVFYDYAEEYLS
jgi:hypothetical protein